jgi:hypothetical protein
MGMPAKYDPRSVQVSQRLQDRSVSEQHEYAFIRRHLSDRAGYVVTKRERILQPGNPDIGLSNSNLSSFVAEHGHPIGLEHADRIRQMRLALFEIMVSKHRDYGGVARPVRKQR